MIYILVKLVHVRITTWCLHKFPCNAHSHVQQTYLVKGSGTLYVIFGCCWLHTIHAWLVSFESSIPWVTWVWRINVAFSMFTFTMRSTTLFFINPSFFISTCACSVLQLLLWISTPTNQSANLEAPLFPKKTNFLIPHGKTQLMLVCIGLNVALVIGAPSTNLQQDTQFTHMGLLNPSLVFLH